MQKQDNYINKFNHYSPEHTPNPGDAIEADPTFYESLKNHSHIHVPEEHTGTGHQKDTVSVDTDANQHTISHHTHITNDMTEHHTPKQHTNDHHTDHTDKHTYHEAAMDQTDTSSEEESSSSIIRAIVILGILILLFFISLAIVKFVPKAIGSLSGASVYLSNIFSKESLALSAKKSTIKPGDLLELSWKNTYETPALYTWGFECTEGITVLYQSVDGKQLPVICDTSFPIPEGATSYSFVVNSSKETNTSFKNTLAYFNKDTKELIATDAIEVTVSKNATVQVTEETKEEVLYTPSTTPSATASTTKNTEETTPLSTGNKKPTTQTSGSTTGSQTVVPVGKNDLAITLVEAKAIKSGTTNITTLTNVGPYDKVYLRFQVANNGQNQTGTWRIIANLPTTIQSDQNYISKLQPSLSPSQTFEMTLIFDAFDTTKREIVIKAENTDDTNTSNNTLRIPISGNGSTSGGNYTPTSGSRADLVTRILDIGIIDDRTNRFISTSNLDVNDIVAVRFEVSNTGTVSSGNYDIKLTVPTEDDDIQYFNNRASLLPGQSTAFTVAIENPEEGSGRIEIEADYNNDVRENSESNNDVSRTLRINN